MKEEMPGLVQGVLHQRVVERPEYNDGPGEKGLRTHRLTVLLHLLRMRHDRKRDEHREHLTLSLIAGTARNVHPKHKAPLAASANDKFLVYPGKRD